MDNNKNFIFSAIIAFSLYFSLLFFFFYYAKSNNLKKINSIAKATVLQLDIVLETPKDIKKKVLIQENTKSSKISQKVVKKSTSTSSKQRSNLKSLFANVKTNVKKVSKEKINNIKKSTISSRFKSKFEKERKIEKLKVSKLSNNKQNSQNKKVATDSKNKVSEFASLLNDELTTLWNRFFLSNRLSDLDSIVLIKIKPDGTFDYTFLKYSGNLEFDNRLKEFLQIQSVKLRPNNPNSDIYTIKTIFKIKE
jgi:periplasmic protein TonB